MNVPENPFESPQEHVDARYTPSKDPSVEHEPHLSNEEFHTEAVHQSRPLHVGSTTDEAVDHTVWDEPGLSADLSGARPTDALTYEGWLSNKIAETSWQKSWTITFLAATLSGILALLGSYLAGGGRAYGNFIQSGLIVPVTQEILKAALVLWIVERRPYLFKTASQVAIACVCGGVTFAMLESLLMTDATTIWGPLLVRGSVAVLIHVVCSLAAAMGLIQVWRHCIEARQKPELARGGAFLIGAVAIHILYNCVLILASFTAYLV